MIRLFYPVTFLSLFQVREMLICVTNLSPKPDLENRPKGYGSRFFDDQIQLNPCITNPDIANSAVITNQMSGPSNFDNFLRVVVMILGRTKLLNYY